MSAIGAAAAAGFNNAIWGNLLAAAKAGVLGNITSTVQALSSDAIGLVGQEAQDFDGFVTKYAELIQTGVSPTDAFNQTWGSYTAQAKSDAWNAAMKALTDGLSFLDGVVKTIEAAI